MLSYILIMFRMGLCLINICEGKFMEILQQPLCFAFYIFAFAEFPNRCQKVKWRIQGLNYTILK